MKIALGLETDKGLVQTALTFGIHAFDTALAYGTECTLKCVPDFAKIVTKVKKDEDVLISFDQSKAAIGKPIHGLLMHNAANFTPEAIFQLEFLKCNKEISKYGLSVYDPSDVPKEAFDIIQFPLSILDQRFLPRITDWKAWGVETWARSCLLRGVLMANPLDLPPYFDPIQRKLRALPKNHVARLSICLNFVKNSGVDYCVMAFKDRIELSLAMSCLADLSTEEMASNDCIDPRKWVK